MLRRIAFALALCAPLPAQQLWPFNVTVHPTAVVMPASYRYRPAIVMLWQPAVAEPFLALEPQGIQVEFYLREFLIVHPIGWAGACPNGFPGVSTRIVASWGGAQEIWPWGGHRVQYLTGLSLRMYAPLDYRVDYGTWFGYCGGGVRPDWCAVLLEVR
jgi:hypothetical protein